MNLERLQRVTYRAARNLVRDGLGNFPAEPQG